MACGGQDFRFLEFIPLRTRKPDIEKTFGNDSLIAPSFVPLTYKTHLSLLTINIDFYYENIDLPFKGNQWDFTQTLEDVHSIPHGPRSPFRFE